MKVIMTPLLIKLKRRCVNIWQMGHRNSAVVREKVMNLYNHYSESGCKE
jgi:hypothetical protein